MNIARKKLRKKARNNFLLTQEYREQKMAGKKRAENFFYKCKNIATKKLEGKKGRNNFLKTQEYREKKMAGKKGLK